MGQDRTSRSWQELSDDEKNRARRTERTEILARLSGALEIIRVKDQMIEALQQESAIAFQVAVNAWQDETFPHATPKSIMTHLKREVAELEEAYGEDEGADVYILLLALAGKVGYKLHAAARRKMLENYQRKWKQPDKDGVVEHVR